MGRSDTADEQGQYEAQQCAHTFWAASICSLEQIALSFTGLGRLEEGQRGIEGFFAAGSSNLEINFTDSKRSRSRSPGSASEINPSPKKPRLPTLHTGKRKTALELFLAKTGESSTASSGPRFSPIRIVSDDDVRPVDDVFSPDVDVPETEVEGERWVCPACKTVFTTPGEGHESKPSRSLIIQRNEHEDYHFALGLQEGDGRMGGTQSKSSNTKVRKKVPKKAEGIKAFFASKPAKVEPP